MKLYLDASALIFAHEAQASLRDWVLQRIEDFLLSPGSVLLTSRISLLECRVAPLRDQNLKLLAEYDRAFSDPSFEVVEISAAIVERATLLRVQHGFKSPDAIHIATAIEHSAIALLTGDERFRRCTEIPIELPPRRN